MSHFSENPESRKSQQEKHQTKLCLWFNKDDKIVKKYINVRFPNLQSIYLNANNLQSIQNLQLPQMKKLKHLQLRLDSFIQENNDITQISILKKCDFQSLQLLKMNLNYILEFDSLSEARIENLSQIDIEFGCAEKNQSQENSFLAKLQSNQVKIVNTKSEYRIRKKVVEDCIKFRFSDFKIGRSVGWIKN